jgi:hypothetical protein
LLDLFEFLVLSFSEVRSCRPAWPSLLILPHVLVDIYDSGFVLDSIQEASLKQSTECLLKQIPENFAFLQYLLCYLRSGGFLGITLLQPQSYITQDAIEDVKRVFAGKEA